MRDLVKVATKIRDAFTYDPGHSDLDNEQPIHICVPLGTWRQLSFILSQIERAKDTRPEARYSEMNKVQLVGIIETCATELCRRIPLPQGESK